MVFHHIGIMNEDEEGALKFYCDILGLEKIKESVASPELARQLFSVDQEMKILVYGLEDLVVEIFIISEFRRPWPPASHICIQVPDVAALIEKAAAQGAKVISANRDGRTVSFIEDFSGNRIELKSRP